MKKLTKKQRYSLYKEMYKLAKERGYFYICHIYNDVTKERKNNMSELTKEIYLMCPKNYMNGVSFTCITATSYNDGIILCDKEATELRLTILEFCIEMTKPTKK